MSKQSLNTFIHRLHQELESYKEYRALLNLEPHVFVFNKNSLVMQTLAQVQKNGNKMPPEVLGPFKAHLRALSHKYGDELINKLESIAGHRLPRPGGKVTMVFAEDTSVPLPNYLENVDPLYLSVFARVKITYREVLNKFFNEMQDWLVDNASEYVVKNKNGSRKKSIMHFYDAGHAEGYGVFERFIDQATQNIAKDMQTAADKDTVAARNRLIAEMKNAGIEITIAKHDDTDSITLKVESAYLNRQRGAKAGQISKKLRAAVNEYVEKNPLDRLEGSDSLNTRKRKKVLHKTLNPFKGLKNVTVTHEDMEFKKSSGPAKAVKPNTGRSKALKIGKVTPKLAKKRIKRRPQKDLFSLVALLNAKLPQKILKNMGEPGLVNRSGRFASSVRVVDAVTTPQGYPSFGYTYQQNPYKVFEQGSKGNWASEDRDPRNLINKSIREIAAEMAIGRFYTRRL